MDREILVIKQTEVELTLKELVDRVNGLDAARKITYEALLRMQGQLQVLTELLALPKSEATDKEV